jgi:hypothetical protein
MQECITCRQWKPLDCFPRRGSKRRLVCKTCTNARCREWRNRHLDDQRAKASRRRKNARQQLRQTDYIRLWAIGAREAAQARAKVKGQRVEITLQDVVELAQKSVACPLLKTLLDYSRACKNAANIPSLDRIDPHGGYTKENVWIISWKANTIKNDASLVELERLLVNLEKRYEEMLSLRSREVSG